MNPNNGAIVIPRRAQGLIVLCAGLVAGLMLLLPVSDRFVFSAMSIAAYVIGLLNGWHFGKDRR